MPRVFLLVPLSLLLVAAQWPAPNQEEDGTINADSRFQQQRAFPLNGNLSLLWFDSF